VRYARDASEFDRAIAFIDATFALALTLLITTLDVDDPASSFASLSAFGDAYGAQLLAFAIAFAVIASYWLEHHRMVASFVSLDRPTIITNLFLIAAIVLLPFTTRSVGDPAVADLPLPTALMAVNIAAVSALSTLVWAVASRRRLLDHVPTPGEWRESVFSGLAPVAVFLGSVPIAYLVSPAAARLFWLTLVVFNPVVGKLLARSRRLRGEG
jgi:TMEM175 potassium channel family protein